jgi:glycosyltransferase involved in cell wall biosynthesis
MSDGARLRYWVVIPVYNERDTIHDVAVRALQQIDSVLVVDDGSNDGTSAAIEALSITLFRNAQNGGKGASLWRGFMHALDEGASGVITLDADGQHAPEEIPKFLAAAAAFPEHLIIGTRERKQRRTKLLRYGANCVADFWVSWASGAPFSDTQSGFRLYPASLLRRISINHEKTHSFVFESEILIEATRLEYRSIELPIDMLPRGGSRCSHFRPILDVLRIALMVAWKLISRGMFPAGLYRSLFTEPLRCAPEIPPNLPLQNGGRNSVGSRYLLRSLWFAMLTGNRK